MTAETINERAARLASALAHSPVTSFNEQISRAFGEVSKMSYDAGKEDKVNLYQNGFADGQASARATAQPTDAPDVFAICDAYESGIGHGLKRDGLANPYKLGSHEHRAYDIGYEEGAKRSRLSTPVEEAGKVPEWVGQFIGEVEKLAYQMPAPNKYTPRFVELCVAASDFLAHSAAPK